ncbi:hypothetical protein EMQU_2935 (plasmid) [Enterococcus mundtii QU 25]|nr:hypothetical protein [Enterococcus mundtii]BAO08492.1 hypothetical protein EMQU_2935 [Enterococcus mundtii QU 25]
MGEYIRGYEKSIKDVRELIDKRGSSVKLNGAIHFAVIDFKEKS